MSAPAARRPARIVTFYSYKGGTGRSMALANIAWILACNGKRVLVIDWDLEAPGLHRYFRPFLLDAELSSSDGLIDLVDRYATAAIGPVESHETPSADWYLEYADFSDHVLGLDFAYFPPGGKIDLLPAGRQSDTYAVKVSSFNWQNFYDRLGGGAFFEAVKARARAEYDYVLIDSRTGVSDTAGICTAQMPDSLVVCFTYNNQSIKGAAAVARSALAMHARIAEEKLARQPAATAEGGHAPDVVADTPAPYVVFPVPMRVDAGESDRLALRQAFARQSFADLVGHIGDSQVGEYWSGVEVPHRVFYAYEEVLAPFKDDAHDPKTVLAAFLRLTTYVTNHEVTDFRLPIAPEVRQSFLDAFAETPLTAQARKAQAEAQRETAEQLLVRNADAALYTLAEEDRSEAQSVLCRLVRVGRDEEGGSNFPIRAPMSDFDSAQRAVIAQLARRGLLGVYSEQTRTQTLPPPIPGNAGTTSTSSGIDQSVGLADGRLVTIWPTLVRWLEADREFLIWRQQLRTYLADWDRSGRDRGAFLSGTLLAEAQLWMHKRAPDLNAVERGYVEASAANAQRVEPPTIALAAAPLPGAAKISSLPAAKLSRRAEAASVTLSAEPARREGGARFVLLGAVAIAALVAVVWWALGALLGHATTGTPTAVGASAPPLSARTPDADPVADKRRRANDQIAIGDQATVAGDPAAAAAAYAQALAIAPDVLEAALKLGRAREAQTDFEGAASAYEQAMAIAPTNPAPWLERGASFAVQGRYKEAIADYTHAIELDGSDASAYFNRGTAHESLKATAAAITDYSAALRLKPDSVAALLARARLSEAGNPRVALADYDSVLALPASAGDQQLARERIKALGARATANGASRVYVQYRDDADLGRVNELRKALAVALKPAEIAAAEQVASSSGDVRYFFTDDEAVARKTMSDTELLLAKQGIRVELKLLRRDAKEFPRARRGTVEIWLPSLTTTQPLPRAVFTQRALPNAPANAMQSAIPPQTQSAIPPQTQSAIPPQTQAAYPKK